MTDFDKAFGVVDDYPKVIKFIFTSLIPGLSGAMAVANGAGLKSIIYIAFGFVFSAFHFFVMYKLVTHDVGENAETLWRLRLSLIACYFICAPGLYLYFCFQVAKQQFS